MDDDQNGCKRTEQDLFVEHLNKASKIVQSWPEWKQSMLGGVSSKPYNNYSRIPFALQNDGNVNGINE